MASSPSQMSAWRRSCGDLLIPSSHLVAQQQPLDSSVDCLGVGLGAHFKGVLVGGQQLFACLFQQRTALRREEGGEIRHLVAAYLCPRGTGSELGERDPRLHSSRGLSPLCVTRCLPPSPAEMWQECTTRGETSRYLTLCHRIRE